MCQWLQRMFIAGWTAEHHHARAHASCGHSRPGMVPIRPGTAEPDLQPGPSRHMPTTHAPHASAARGHRTRAAQSTARILARMCVGTFRAVRDDSEKKRRPKCTLKPYPQYNRPAYPPGTPRGSLPILLQSCGPRMRVNDSLVFFRTIAIKPLSHIENIIFSDLSHRP